MKKRFSYVYILQSEVDPERFYVGLAIKASQCRANLAHHQMDTVANQDLYRVQTKTGPETSKST